MGHQAFTKTPWAQNIVLVVEFGDGCTRALKSQHPHHRSEVCSKGVEDLNVVDYVWGHVDRTHSTLHAVGATAAPTRTYYLCLRAFVKLPPTPLSTPGKGQTTESCGVADVPDVPGSLHFLSQDKAHAPRSVFSNILLRWGQGVKAGEKYH